MNFNVHCKFVHSSQIEFYRGYFPKGGGEVVVKCSPVKSLQPIDMTEFGSMTKMYGRAFVAGNIPIRVGTFMSTFHSFVIENKFLQRIKLMEDIISFVDCTYSISMNIKNY